MSNVIDLGEYRAAMANDLTVDRGPNTPDVLICMDDRAVDPDCEVAGSVEYYSQLAGGSSGVGHTAAVVLESRGVGKFVNLNIPVFAAGSLISKLCKTELGLQLMNHHVCAAHLGAAAIDMTAVKEPEPVFASARAFKPDLTELEFEQTIGGIERVLTSGLLIPPNKALEKLQAGEPPQHPSVPTAKLVQKDHNAVAYLMDYRRNKVLDVPAANEAGMATYYSSARRFEDISKAIRNTFPIGYEDFLNVYAIRLGAIRARHLKGPQGEELPVVIFDEAQAA